MHRKALTERTRSLPSQRAPSHKSNGKSAEWEPREGAGARAQVPCKLEAATGSGGKIVPGQTVVVVREVWSDHCG